METTMNKLKVYKNEVFEEKIEKDIELIARYVADTSPFDNLKITDEFDNLILYKDQLVRLFREFCQN